MAKQKGFATLLSLGLIFAALAGGAVIGKHLPPDSVPEEAIEAYLRTHNIDCEFSPHADNGRND